MISCLVPEHLHNAAKIIRETNAWTAMDQYFQSSHLHCSICYVCTDLAQSARTWKYTGITLYVFLAHHSTAVNCSTCNVSTDLAHRAHGNTLEIHCTFCTLFPLYITVPGALFVLIWRRPPPFKLRPPPSGPECDHRQNHWQHHHLLHYPLSWTLPAHSWEYQEYPKKINASFMKIFTWKKYLR